MPLCGGCNQETSRLKVIFREDGSKEEYCKLCRPEDFDKWVDPSNTHGGYRWQYEPEKYKKRYMPDGSVFYEAKDERNQDLEDQIKAPNPVMQTRNKAAAEQKRLSRRTTPLEPWEIEQRTNRIKARLDEARQKKLTQSIKDGTWTVQ